MTLSLLWCYIVGSGRSLCLYFLRSCQVVWVCDLQQCYTVILLLIKYPCVCTSTFIVRKWHGLDILKESSSSTVGGEKCQLRQLSLGHMSNENVTVYDHCLQEKWMWLKVCFYNVYMYAFVLSENRLDPPMRQLSNYDL